MWELTDILDKANLFVAEMSFLRHIQNCAILVKERALGGCWYFFIFYQFNTVCLSSGPFKAFAIRRKGILQNEARVLISHNDFDGHGRRANSVLMRGATGHIVEPFLCP